MITSKNMDSYFDSIKMMVASWMPSFDKLNGHNHSLSVVILSTLDGVTMKVSMYKEKFEPHQ